MSKQYPETEDQDDIIKRDFCAVFGVDEDFVDVCDGKVRMLREKNES